MRLYAAHNKLVYLWSATYRGEGQRELGGIRRDIRTFFRRLRRDAGRLPYLWVPEWHPGGHGLHLHFAIDRWFDKDRMDSLWAHGFTFVRGPEQAVRDGSGSGSRSDARRVARYVSKYVAKDISLVPPGWHRYDVAQGFRPVRIDLGARTRDEAIALAAEVMGAPPDKVFDSRANETWDGRPSVWMSWT